MAKESQTSQEKSNTKDRRKPKSAVPDQSRGQAAIAEAPVSPIGVIDNPTIQRQAARLNDSRFSKAQRQALSRQIGRRHGNRHLQMVMTAVNHQKSNNGFTSDGDRPKSTSSQRPAASGIQPKLMVNEPDDQYEQEADQVADEVMRMTASTPVPPPDDEDNPSNNQSSQGPRLQTSRPQTSPDDVVDVPPDLEGQIDNLSDGSPLSDQDRDFFEARIGSDFSDVRLHTNGKAIQTSQDLNARAYTIGSDIVFNEGEYQPGSEDGRHLLAHELTHVVQQGEADALQRQEATEGDLPTEEEKAEALKKAEAAKGEAGVAKDKGQAQKEKSQAEAESKQAEGEGAKQEAAGSKSAGPVSKEAEGSRQAAVQDKTAALSAEGEAQQAAAGEAAQAAIQEAINGTAAGVAEARTENAAVPTEIPAGGGPGEGTGADPEGATPAATATVEAEFGAVEETPDKAPDTPTSDPAYQAVATAGKAVGQEKQTHEPANTKADAAQAAAESPTSELEGQAQAVQVGEMEQSETPAFDEAAFKAKLMDRVKELAPKSPGEADEFKESGEMAGVKGEMQGQVAQEREASQGPLEEKSGESPDIGNAEPKPVTPLPETNPGEVPLEIGAEQAAPKPKGKGEFETPLQEGSKSLDDQMADANITEEQLANSNEPQFQETLSAKQEAQTAAAEAPPEYRAAEQAELEQAEGEASAEAQEQMEGMQGDRADLFTQVAEQQGETISEDEQKRAEIAGHINGIYEQTKTKVETILSELDGEVSRVFDQGAEAARLSFEDYVDRETEAFKQERYGGWLGWAQWVADQFSPSPRLNQIVDEGVQHYINEMDAVIDQVVSIISTHLAEAKAEVARGKQDVQDYVNQLPEDLQSIGQEAAQEVQSNFDQLEQSIDDKQNELIDTLADKYQESLEIVNTQAEEMREANKGLIERAIDAVGGTIKAILKMKDMLMSIVAKAGDVIETIINDPIGFLGNLLEAVKLGFGQFVDNIGTHLKKGLISWLTGSLADAGITLPESFDLPGIFQLVMQMLGLSFEYIIGKISDVFGIDIMGIIDPIMQLIAIYQEEGFAGLIKFGLAKLIGEENMQHLMKVWEIIQLVMSGNFAQLWEVLQEYLDSLKETVMGQIIEFITEKVIVAGAKWVISLFNPASAFIKACMMIYDVVMFFIQRGSQIIQLVNAVLDSLGNIASGNIGGAANFIENALGTAIPIAISFLSSLLGLGDISGRIQEIIKSVRGMVDSAIDGLLNSGPVQAVVGFIKGIVGKVVALAQAGFEKAKGALGFGEDDDEKAGKAAIRSEEQKYIKDGKVSKEDAEKVASTAQGTQDVFQSVRVVDGGDSWNYDYVVQRATLDTPAEKEEDEENLPLKDGDIVSAHLDNTSAWYKSTVTIDKENKLVFFRVIKNEEFERKFYGRTAPSMVSLPADKDAINSAEGKLWSREHQASQVFEPKNLKQRTLPDGGEEIKYSTLDGTEFTVTIQPGSITSTGKHLKLKTHHVPIEGEGKKELETHAQNMEMERAHIIAERFMGSGHAAASNLVSTSPEYNDPEMKNAETKIADLIKSSGASEFDLTVTVSLGEFSSADIISQMQANHGSEAGDPQEIKAKLTDFLTRHLATGTELKRCMKVVYKGELIDRKGEPVSIEESIGADIWLGLTG